MKALSIGRRFLRLEFGQLLAPLLERRRAFAGPHHGVEREPRDHLRVPLGEHRGAQRAGRNAVNEERAACRAASGYRARRRSSRRRLARSARCCRGPWSSGRSPPCRRTSSRSRGGRSDPSPRNSGRPGTCRSKVGCEAIDEPCTNRIVPMVFAGSPAHFSNRNSFTPPSLLVQCSSPLIARPACSFRSSRHLC